MRAACGPLTTILGVLSGWRGVCGGVFALASETNSNTSGARDASTRGGKGGDLLREELSDLVERFGMELVMDAEELAQEWSNAPRRLAFEGSNCLDVVVSNSPENICDGTYEGIPNDNPKTLRGPSLFVASCFEPNICSDDGSLLGLNRRMFMARAFRCEEGQTDDCPKETVWGVYSAITNEEGENELGFLRAWANGAIHPVDVTSQWWTFQYTNLDPPENGQTRECTNPDCLLPVDGVTLECSPDTPNETLPPGWTPYPSPAPTSFDTFAPIPTPSPASLEDSSADASEQNDLNSAVGLSPWSSSFGGGWRAGIVAIAVWWAGTRVASDAVGV